MKESLGTKTIVNQYWLRNAWELAIRIIHHYVEKKNLQVLSVIYSTEQCLHTTMLSGELYVQYALDLHCRWWLNDQGHSNIICIYIRTHRVCVSEMLRITSGVNYLGIQFRFSMRKSLRLGIWSAIDWCILVYVNIYYGWSRKFRRLGNGVNINIIVNEYIWLNICVIFIFCKRFGA